VLPIRSGAIHDDILLPTCSSWHAANAPVGPPGDGHSITLFQVGRRALEISRQPNLPSSVNAGYGRRDKGTSRLR